MKRIVIALAVITLIAASAPSLFAKDVDMPAKDAQIHRVVGPTPGTVEVVAPYDRAIKLEKLDKNTVAYWNPDGGKYIIADAYAYVWCKIYNTKNASTHYGWVAVNSDAMNKSVAIAEKAPSGVAFYKIYPENDKIVMEAIPYNTINAIARGEPTVDIMVPDNFGKK